MLSKYLSLYLLFILLIISGCTPNRNKNVRSIDINIDNNNCVVTPDTVGIGNVKFNVHLKTNKVNEIELLKDNKVFAEKENLVPNVNSYFYAHLPSGKYTLNCPGVKNNNSHYFTVKLDDNKNEVIEGIDKQFKEYLLKNAIKLEDEYKGFKDNILNHKLDDARKAYPFVHGHYEILELAEQSFSEVDPSIDEHDAGQSDLHGFHLIEKYLFTDNAKDININDELNTLEGNINKLQPLINDFKYTPDIIANGMIDIFDEISKTKVTGEEEVHSHTDLQDISNNINGTEEGFNIIMPVIECKKDIVNKIRDDFNQVKGLINKYVNNDGSFVSFDQVSSNDKSAISNAVNLLANDFSNLPSVIASNKCLKK